MKPNFIIATGFIALAASAMPFIAPGASQILISAARAAETMPHSRSKARTSAQEAPLRLRMRQRCLCNALRHR